MKSLRFLVGFFALAQTGLVGFAQDLKIESLGKLLDTTKFNIIDKQEEFSTGGSTSLRNNTKDNLIWKDEGYFQRKQRAWANILWENRLQIEITNCLLCISVFLPIEQ